MEGILDFSRELDIGLLDRVVNTFYTGHGAEQQMAQQVLTQFQENPDAWQRAADILEKSQVLQSRFLALQLLEKLIQTRWKALPAETSTNIKNYVVSTVIKYSSDEEVLHRERTFVNKLNMILVQVLKQEWPHNWPTFIPEIVQASRTNVALCENNMVVLKLLSEEIFDFSAEQMTQEKAKNLKAQMCGEFSEIFQLCNEVLSKAEKPSLIKATLETLLRFLNWIPLGYVFETNIIDMLRERFLDVPAFRNLSLKCLTEIGGLVADSEYDEKFVLLFDIVTAHISRLVPISTDIEAVYANSSDRDQEFIQNLGLFFTTILHYHLRVIEKHANREHLMLAHQYLIKISRVEEREVFKICLEYWNQLVSELYRELKSAPAVEGASRAALGAAMGGIASLHGGSSLSGGPAAADATGTYRREMYAQVLQALRVVMIERMVKPEEVLVVENDEGEIVRESLKESDTIVLYKSQREVLVYLTHLDAFDTEEIMTAKLGRQMDSTEWSWANLNKLCWAIGSISGAMTEECEKRFLVTVIKDLLGLCEQKRGKDNKAVVASNIMYVVGQYPRFLKAHWRFLKTVVNKLFEFMHELHEGVQDMACDTFIKISQKCRRHFVMQQIGEQRPYVEEIIEEIPSITSDLQSMQIHTFYEAVGYMINAQANRNLQGRLVSRCMEGPNSVWDELIGQLGQGNLAVLEVPENVKLLNSVLKTNVSACLSIGPGFLPQLARIFHDVLSLYRTVSESISAAVVAQGNVATKTPRVRQMRGVKKDTLRLVRTYIQSLEGNGVTGQGGAGLAAAGGVVPSGMHDADMDKVVDTMIPSLLDAVLSDYAQNVEAAREPEVLSATAAIIEVLGDRMTPSVPAILDAVFECTLGMISRDFSEYPEHRVGFFALIKAINSKCFPALLSLPPQQFKLVFDSIVWAFKHQFRDIMDTGLIICEELLDNVAGEGGGVAAAFYQSYFLALLQDVFAVLTDNEHKSGFRYQCDILARLFGLVALNQITAPLDPSVTSPEGNAPFLRQYVTTILLNAYKQNVQAADVQRFVDGLFALHANRDQFKLHVRDFLIQLKEQIGDTTELFVDEVEAEKERQAALERNRNLAVPGLVKPADLPDTMED